MENSKILIYDGSFNGFLTAIYVAFESKIQVADIQASSVSQNGLFADTATILTQMDKAKRVWNGIQEKSSSAIKNVYFSYLSEYEGIEYILYRYIRQLFAHTNFEHSSHSEGIALKVRQLAKNVSHVKERLEAFIGFGLTHDEVYFSAIEPEYNVLPLITKHLRSRLPHQPWIVYDQKRKYGLFYNLLTVELITLDLPIKNGHFNHKSKALSHGERNEYKTMIDYFNEVDILQHINEKVYSQNIAKEYFGYSHERKAV